MNSVEILIRENKENDNEESDLFGTAEVIVDVDPTNSQWRNVDGPSPYKVSATVDGAREEA